MPFDQIYEKSYEEQKMGDVKILGTETEETKSGVSKSKALQLTATKQLDIGKYLMKS